MLGHGVLDREIHNVGDAKFAPSQNTKTRLLIASHGTSFSYLLLAPLAATSTALEPIRTAHAVEWLPDDRTLKSSAAKTA
jgi:hypothetical protein